MAQAALALVGGTLSQTTGLIIPVDSGVAAAFLGRRRSMIDPDTHRRTERTGQRQALRADLESLETSLERTAP